MKTYTFTFSEDELRIIAAGLNELPHKVAAPFLARLQRDIDAQEKAALEAEVSKKAAEVPPEEKKS